jgi:L-arabinokinase
MFIFSPSDSYHVDRRKSVQILEDFLKTKNPKVDTELQWLRSERITCVLSDAVFLAWHVSAIWLIR